MIIALDPLTAPRRRVATTLLGLFLLLGCSSAKKDLARYLPPPAGQLPADYTIEVTRGVVLARINPVTNGEPGLGPITNALIIQLQVEGEAAEVLDPFGADARVWGSPSQRPSQWRYDAPGLLAMSVAPTAYAGMLIAYPDPSHESATPSSIPNPSAGLTFAPIKVAPGAIVYIGDIELRQTISGWDRLLDRVQVDYVISDNYDAAVAELRARYPQLADVPVERHIAQVVTPPSE